MIGSGIFNQPIMGNRVFAIIQNIAKFCLSGMADAVSSIQGLAVNTSELVGINENTNFLTARVKQRCDSDC